MNDRFSKFAVENYQNSQGYRDFYSEKELHGVEDFIPISGNDVFAGAKELKNFPGPGYIFASGGTTGAPKFVFYSEEEFKITAAMLAKGFSAQGVGAGTVCANLFMAGGMWSSFMAVDRALKKCGAIQLPIGGQTEIAVIADFLSRFEPSFVIGLPSLLLTIAEYCQERNIKLIIPKICYAGEHVSKKVAQTLRELWGTTQILSAGYASVDAGPVGYQCKFLTGTKHHLFSDQVLLEIIEGEGVVTSTVRKHDPIIRLRTGDRLEVLKDFQCECKSLDIVFELLERCDQQINIWGIRIYVEEIQKAISRAELNPLNFQLVVRANPQSGADQLSILLEKPTHLTSDSASLVKSELSKINQDLISHPDQSKMDIILENTSISGFLKIPRTGKVPLIRDLRS
ncbi:MAG: hypothetical protein V4736_03470 [Bdellovibrionota bacterium]